MEGQIVRVADINAYLNHDLEDALRSRVITESQVPERCLDVIGRTHSERATTMIHDLVYSSRNPNGVWHLNMGEELFSAMTQLRSFLYENVYRSPRVHNEFVKARKILSELYGYFLENKGSLEKEMIRMEMSGCNKNGQPPERTVCDFIASMTDRYAMSLYARIFFPSPLV